MILLISRRNNDCTMTAEDRLWETSKFLEILYMERGYIKDSYCRQAFCTTSQFGNLLARS